MSDESIGSSEIDDRAALIKTRHATHGDFTDVAEVFGGFVVAMKRGRNWGRLSARRKLALQEIQHKVARILSGDPNCKDHWHDIGGYAKLGEDG